MPATDITFASDVHSTAVQSSVLSAWRQALLRDQRADGNKQVAQHDDS